MSSLIRPTFSEMGTPPPSRRLLGRVGITDVIALMVHYTSIWTTLDFYDVAAVTQDMAR